MYVQSTLKINQKGFTLVELLVTVAIVGILTVVAIPSYKQLIISSQMSSQANEFLTSLYFTRSDAVKRNARVTICKSAGNSSCVTTGTWAQGWIVFVDTGTAGTFDGTDTVLREHAALPASSTFVGSTGVANFVSYLSNGQSPQSGQFDLCNSDTSFAGKDIILSVGTGRPSVVSDLATCS